MSTTHEQVEKLIDDSSLPELMIVVMDVCRDKAEHIRVNWQDEHSATVWDSFANAIDNTRAFWKTWRR